jgi:hypothetical protein
MAIKLRIVPDTSPANPRKEWDNLGTIICFHRKYNLGDEHNYEDQFDFLADLAEYEGEEDLTLEELYDLASEKAVILPVYLYDYSDITTNTTGFLYSDSLGWDWGQIGWVYVTRRKLQEEGLANESDEKIAKKLRAEMEIYNQYLRGDVWGYILQEETICPECDQVKVEQIDLCYGFYGTDWDKNGLKDCLPKEYHHLLADVELEY